MAILFGLGLFVGIIVIMAVIRGWVLTCLWEWFIVPQFHLDPLTIKMAIGLSLVVGMFQHVQSSKDDDTSSTVKMVVSLGLPFFTLFLGWLVHSC